LHAQNKHAKEPKSQKATEKQSESARKRLPPQSRRDITGEDEDRSGIW